MTRAWTIYVVLLFIIFCIALFIAPKVKTPCRSCAVDQELIDEWNNPTIIVPPVEEQKEEVSEIATVTGYTAIESCSNTGCYMANGEKAYVGAVACPRKLPFGTVVTIEGFGDLVCSDRTALRFDGRYDVFMGYTQEDYQKAIQFGKRQLKVIIKE